MKVMKWLKMRPMEIPPPFLHELRQPGCEYLRWRLTCGQRFSHSPCSRLAIALMHYITLHYIMLRFPLFMHAAEHIQNLGYVRT
jgi:hypothetical protein